MKPEEEIKELICKSDVTTDPKIKERILGEALEHLRSMGQTKTQSAQPEPNIGRTIMKSKTMRLAAAAVIVLACVIGLSLWRTTGSGIALADVLNQVQQITAYMYQMTMTINGKGPGGLDMNQNIESTVLISQDYGMKMTMGMSDPNGGRAEPTETYMLPGEKAMITIIPFTKKYIRMELDETMAEKTRQQNYDPGTMLRQILDCKYESLGRSVIDGVEVEGFHTSDPNYAGSMGGQVDVKIWVDVKTQLPVREEMDMQMENMPMVNMKMHSVVHNFQWNYPVDAETFKPDIPADYTALAGGTIKMPAMDEQGAIAGLKLCANLTGRYPEKLDFMTVASMMSKIEDEDETPMKQLMEEDHKDIDALNQLIEEERSEESFKGTEELSKTIEELRKGGQDQSKKSEELTRKIEELRKAGEERIKASEERQKKTEDIIKQIEERRKARQEQIKSREEQFNKTRDENLKETMDKIMPIQGAVMFYMTLVQEKKDPAYHGNVVTPQDADKVLLRWKASDNEYRVIYGDLRAETVSPEKLKQLEAALPK